MHMQMQIAVTCYCITLLHTHSTPTVVLRIDSCSQSTFTWLAGELQLQFHMVNHAHLFCVPLLCAPPSTIMIATSMSVKAWRRPLWVALSRSSKSLVLVWTRRHGSDDSICCVLAREL
jgi:hypothetical protein